MGLFYTLSVMNAREGYDKVPLNFKIHRNKRLLTLCMNETSVVGFRKKNVSLFVEIAIRVEVDYSSC